MAYKFQLGDAILSGALLQDGNVEIESGFDLKMGSTTISEAEIGVLDAVSAGTAAASKALVLDASSVLDGASDMIISASALSASSGQFGDLTVSANSITIGSTTLNETEMQVLDGVSAGTATASKALVVDSNKDIAGIRNLSGVQGTFSSLTQGRLVTAGSSGLLEDQAALYYDDARTDGYLELVVSSSASGSAVLGDGYFVIRDNSDNTLIEVSKYDAGEADSGMFIESDAAPDAAAAATDKIMFLDDSDGSRVKVEAIEDVRDFLIYASVSGDATIANGGALTIAAAAVEGTMLSASVADGTTMELSSDTLSVLKVPNALSQGDGITAFSFDGNGVATVALSASVAGDGLGYSSGVLSVQVHGNGGIEVASDALQLNIDDMDLLAGANLAQGDEFAFHNADSGSVGAVTFSDLEDSIFANISGDATVAAGGALTIESAAVESGMLNDNVISGQTELTANGLAVADELLISDGGTLKKIGVDTLFLDGPALLSSGSVDVAADFFVFLDGSGDGDSKKESIVDLVSAMAGSGLTAANGQLSTQGSTVALKADGDTLAEGYNYFAQLSASNVGVDLPAAPSVGDVIHVKLGDVLNDKILRITPYANHTIDGESTIDLESPYAAVSLVYVVSGSWRIV